MSARYRLSPAAIDDMDRIVDYLREQNPIAAIRFVEAAQATFEYLCETPQGYPRLDTNTSTEHRIGEAIRAPYGVQALEVEAAYGVKRVLTSPA